MPYFVFVSCFVFLELGLCVKKQFLKHLPSLGISGDFEHRQAVFNVLSDRQKRSTKTSAFSNPTAAQSRQNVASNFEYA